MCVTSSGEQPVTWVRSRTRSSRAPKRTTTFWHFSVPNERFGKSSLITTSPLLRMYSFNVIDGILQDAWLLHLGVSETRFGVFCSSSFNPSLQLQCHFSKIPQNLPANRAFSWFFSYLSTIKSYLLLLIPEMLMSKSAHEGNCLDQDSTVFHSFDLLFQGGPRVKK